MTDEMVEVAAKAAFLAHWPKDKIVVRPVPADELRERMRGVARNPKEVGQVDRLCDAIHAREAALHARIAELEGELGRVR